MIRALSFLSLAALCFSAAPAEESIDIDPIYLGKKNESYARIKLPGDVLRQEIVRRSTLDETGPEICLYADEKYIVVHKKLVIPITAEDVRAQERDDASYLDADENEPAAQESDEPPSAQERGDENGPGPEAAPPAPVIPSADKTCLGTAFYDSRTLQLLFYLPFAATEVIYNPELNVFALITDEEAVNNTFRSLYVTLLDPVTRQGGAMRFKGPAIGSDDEQVLTWNGTTLELRLGFGPMIPTFEIYRFESPFLKQPVSVVSIDINAENEISYDEMEARQKKEQQRRATIRKTLFPDRNTQFLLRPGRMPGSIAYSPGKDLVYHLDFDSLQFETIAVPAETVIDIGPAPQGALRIYSQNDWDTHYLTMRTHDGQQTACVAPYGVTFSPDSTLAWDKNRVYDVTPEGWFHSRFKAPDDRSIIGVDPNNREIIVQSDQGPYEPNADIDQWRERMMPSAFDLDTGKLKTARCNWFEPGYPSHSTVENIGCAIGEAPKGWRLSTHREALSRLNMIESSLALRLPSGQCVGTDCDDHPNFDVISQSLGTVDNGAALYRCGADSEFLLLLGDGYSNGTAFILNNDTLKSRLIAEWPAGNPPLWLPGKNWLFVPRGEDYEVVHIDSRGKVTPAFRFFPARGGYAIVLPNGLYAGTPGCEQLLQFRDEPDGLRRLAPWRNRPGTVLKALGGNRDSIRQLKASTRQRLKQARVNTDKPEPSFEGLPRVTIARLPDLFAKPDEQRIVTATFTATKRPITSLVKSENGVIEKTPLEAPVSPGQSAAKEVRVSIAPGSNWIELRAVDADGVAGEPFRFRIIGRYSYEGSASVPGGAARSLFNGPLFTK